MKKLEILLLSAVFLFALVAPVLAEESGELSEPEYLEWSIGFIGLIAAFVAAYTGVKAFGGMIGSAMKLYAVGILLIGIASITCFIFYIAGIGDSSELSVQIEDNLRTMALLIFAYAGYSMYAGRKRLVTDTVKRKH